MQASVSARVPSAGHAGAVVGEVRGQLALFTLAAAYSADRVEM
jgi:hypothetical protein